MREKDRTPFGQRLFDARKNAGLSQIELAKRAGLSQSTLAGLEKDGQGSARTVYLAAACKVSAKWLADNEGPMVPDVVKTRGTPTVADAIRDEQGLDPYQLIEQGLRALLIVSHAKDSIMKSIKEAAETAAATQRLVQEQFGQKAKGRNH